LFDVVSGLREFFVKKYPLCNMELNGPQAGIVLKHGSWFTLALKELLDNAGEAAGAEGRVSFSWKVKGAMEFFVQNEGAQIPPSIRFDPPCPFLTSKSRHEGLGLAVAYRICSQTGSEFKIKNTGGKVIASMKLPEREVAE
jgi:K+-sensing histidine kinase KdpD